MSHMTVSGQILHSSKIMGVTPKHVEDDIEFVMDYNAWDDDSTVIVKYEFNRAEVLFELCNAIGSHALGESEGYISVLCGPALCMIKDVLSEESEYLKEEKERYLKALMLDSTCRVNSLGIVYWPDYRGRSYIITGYNNVIFRGSITCEQLYVTAKNLRVAKAGYGYLGSPVDIGYIRSRSMRFKYGTAFLDMMKCVEENEMGMKTLSVTIDNVVNRDCLEKVLFETIKGRMVQMTGEHPYGYHMGMGEYLFESVELKLDEKQKAEALDIISNIGSDTVTYWDLVEGMEGPLSEVATEQEEPEQLVMRPDGLGRRKNKRDTLEESGIDMMIVYAAKMQVLVSLYNLFEVKDESYLSTIVDMMRELCLKPDCTDVLDALYNEEYADEFISYKQAMDKGDNGYGGFSGQWDDFTMMMKILLDKQEIKQQS